MQPVNVILLSSFELLNELLVYASYTCNNDARIQNGLSERIQLWQRYVFSWWGDGGSKYND